MAATQQMSGGLLKSARCVANLRGPHAHHGRYCADDPFAIPHDATRVLKRT